MAGQEVPVGVLAAAAGTGPVEEFGISRETVYSYLRAAPPAEALTG
jgi:hypothetical protein